MLRLFCKHKYIANGYVTEPIGNGHYRRKTIWKCTKCGKERLGEKTWGKEKSKEKQVAKSMRKVRKRSVFTKEDIQVSLL